MIGPDGGESVPRLPLPPIPSANVAVASRGLTRSSEK